MNVQLQRNYSNQSISHAITIYNYPQDYSDSIKCMGYRYLLQYGNQSPHKTPQDREIIQSLKTLFESCILIKTKDKLKTAHEIADIIINHNFEEEGEVILQRLRETMDRHVARDIPIRNIIHEEIPVINRINQEIKVRTLYNDSQNIHNKDINNSVKDACIKLMKKYSNLPKFKDLHVSGKPGSDIESILLKKFSTKTNSIQTVLDRINIDISNFNINISLHDILKCVWLWIHEQEEIDELEKRLVEEIIEMEGYCATGHLGRLVNVMQGFTDDMKIQVSDEDQYNKIIRAYLTDQLSNCTDDDVIDGMIDKNDDYKHFIRDNVDKMLPKWREEYGEMINKYVYTITNKYADMNVY
jgi:hypothetical protein